MFKNNISKELCQQIDKKNGIINQKVQASKASEEKKLRHKANFCILRILQGKMLSKKKEDFPYSLTFWQNLADPTFIAWMKIKMPPPPQRDEEPPPATPRHTPPPPNSCR